MLQYHICHFLCVEMLVHATLLFASLHARTGQKLRIVWVSENNLVRTVVYVKLKLNINISGVQGLISYRKSTDLGNRVFPFKTELWFFLKVYFLA